MKGDGHLRLKTVPICETCRDTRKMWLSSSERYVMCTACPVPCGGCREGGNGAYCAEIRCGCVCHRKDRRTAAGRAYRSWEAMKQRCLNPNDAAYERYGGRGIQIYSAWVLDFEAFYPYLKAPPEGMTLDRYPDNDGNYRPGNVRWATPREQAVNRRSTRLFELDGRVQCLTDWGRELGLTGHSVLRRIRRGWSAAEALTRPPQHRKVGALLSAGEEARTLSEWARTVGISPQALGMRLKRMSLREALAVPPGPSSCPRPTRRKEKR